MPNKKRLIKVRDTIHAYKERFNYSVSRTRVDRPHSAILQEKNYCGTTGCVAGFAIALFPRVYKKLSSASILGLTDDETAFLFCPSSKEEFPDDPYLETYKSKHNFRVYFDPEDEHKYQEAIDRINHLLNREDISTNE